VSTEGAHKKTWSICRWPQPSYREEMSFDSQRGTYGARQPKGAVMRTMNTMAARRIRHKPGVKMMGCDTLVLTALGRRSGVARSTPIAWFADGNGNWLVVASANGAVDNPSWYYNVAANPDRLSIEIGQDVVAVTAEQLHGAERNNAWNLITTAAPRFAKYQQKTDRDIPVIRLTRAAA
jgi:deazaflavin-dependent oxidoreductase (nitroreductase family)